MNVKEILLPTDFSAASESAGQVARDMARQAGARLHVVYVAPPVMETGNAGELLARVATQLGEGLVVETALLTGRPARQIVEYARRKNIGLIVLGTHGRTGVSRAILGSVAESVIRLAPCLVLMVPPAILDPETQAESAAPEVPAIRQCLVCARQIEDTELVCEPCRTKIRAEALERKLEAERPGRHR